MLSQDMLSFLPLHSGAIDSQVKLLSWIESWCKDIEVLTPEDCFVRGHNIYGYCKNLDKVTIPLS